MLKNAYWSIWNFWMQKFVSIQTRTSPPKICKICNTSVTLPTYRIFQLNLAPESEPARAPASARARARGRAPESAPGSAPGSAPA